MNPFMKTFTEPLLACWHNNMLAADGSLYAIPRTDADWTAPYLHLASRGKYRPNVVGYDLFAHPDSWAAMGAVHLAAAYRPEGLP